MRPERSWPVFLCALAIAVTATFAEVALVLKDGRVLEGVDVRREGGDYLLELESGDVVSIPTPLVDEVQLKEKPDEPETLAGYPEAATSAGFRDAGPEVLAGEDIKEGPGPAGFQNTGPQVLAGEQIKPPRTKDQLAVFGEPSKFQKGVINPAWHPTSDWDMSQENNNFAPSSWAENVIDPTWVPESSLGEDQTKHNEATWSDSVIDNSWQPKDGFSKG